MKILLVHPPIRLHSKPLYPPLGLGYIASVLIEEGYDVTLLDINGYRYSPEQVQQKIRSTSYDIIGIGGIITQYSYTKWLTRIIRQHDPTVKIIVGGGLASSAPNILLQKTNADIAVVGEGEVTIKEIVNKLAVNNELADVKGIYYKQNHKIIANPPRVPISDLGSLPFPAWHLFPMGIYLKNQGEHIRYLREYSNKLMSKEIRSMYVSTVRGCPYKCAFCYHPYYGCKVRARPVDSIIEEIRVLKDKYKVNFVQFADDLFFLNKKRVYQVCDGLIQADLDINWIAGGRANLVDEEMLRKAKVAGCVYVGYGIESGSQRILDLMHKEITVEHARNAIEITRKVGLGCGPSFMIGFPGETKETIEETVKFMSEMGVIRNFFYTTPYPGTPLYEWAKVQGKIKDDDAYFEHISKIGDAKTFAINLTDFSDEELIHLKKKAETEAMINIRRNLYHATMHSCKYFGFYQTVKTVIGLIRELGVKNILKILLIRRCISRRK